MAIGGAKNAGLLAVQILAISDPELTKKLEAYKESLRALVGEMNDRISTTS
jgi:5-(carboxyamino)imidazole ribonucleotide mutase